MLNDVKGVKGLNGICSQSSDIPNKANVKWKATLEDAFDSKNIYSEKPSIIIQNDDECG